MRIPILALLLLGSSAPAAEPLFERKNLVAWCIVPFDAKKRSPEERVAMLKRLGFTKYAYDWRAEHLPTFDREVAELQKANIELTAIWFPAGLNADAQTLLAVVKKHKLKTQLWITMGDFGGKDQSDKDKVEAAAKVIRPIAEEADKLGCTVALYNHGGWFGEPENQIAIIEQLKLKNVGIVYNQHHGHDHLDRFPALLRRMKPHLLALNLNGMVKEGEKLGKKILPLGAGDLDVELLKTIAASGYKGPIGILGHTNDDAEERLQDNLDGLDWLRPQLDGKPARPKPKYRTLSAATPPATSGWVAEGKAEYRSPPITVEARAKITAKSGFNILVASDTKASANHWEMFTWPNSGALTVYMPGMKPDHVKSETDVCDGKWHTVAMQYEATRVRLYVDGKKVADQEVKRDRANAVPGGIAFARLVEGGVGLTGELEKVRVSKGIVEPSDKPLSLTDDTLGLWTFAAKDKPAEDAKGKNTAKPQAAGVSSIQPPPGPNLKVDDPKLKVTLISRSDDDAYMAVKLDGAGNLFVGGREKVFVFEPDGQGGFKPRRDLLTFPPDSIIIGLEYRGDDLYVLASHALYLVKDGRVKRTDLKPNRILWGLPLDYHVSFHCLTWGPEGDLYLTHGDPLLNYGDWSRPDHWGCWPLYAGPDGKKHHYTGQGAVLKVKPDGSDPKVIARGLRGPVGLCFDSKWNLFTNDNDHESRADQYAPMRLLHVTPHAEFAWPRGWMASKSPDRADLLDSINTNLGRGVPCDLAFYDEPAIPALRGQLLQCRWDRFAVTRYVLKPNGATFTAEELVFAQGSSNCRPTGVAIDTNGRIFVTSHYLAGNVQVPHCYSDLVMIAPEGLKWEPKNRLSVMPVGELKEAYPEVLNISKFNEAPLGFRLRWAISSDPVLRQRSCMEFARTGSIREIEQMMRSREGRMRLGGVLAAGIRLTVPPADAPPPDGVPLFFPKFNGWFNPVLTFADEPKTVDLAKLGPIGSYTMAEKWKATKHTDEEEKLFALLLKALDDEDDLVRSQAAYYLGWLRDPRSEPKIAAVRLGLRTKGLKDLPPAIVKEAWSIGRFPTAEAAIERGPIDLAAKVGASSWEVVKSGDTGVRLVDGKGLGYGWFRIQSRERQTALLAKLPEIDLWHNGRIVPPEADGSRVLDLQPGGNDILVRTGGFGPLHFAIRAKSTVSIALPEKPDGTSLAERLKGAKGPAAVPPEFLKVDWAAEAKKGDAANGRKLFGTLGCAKCHAITADQAGGGAPSLAEAGKRFTTAHLVESILMPDRFVADEFRAASITTLDGVTLSGLIVKEANGEIEVLLPDATRRTIKAADIETRKAVAASPMPSGVVKTVAELRDVLTYILSDNPQPP